MITVFGAGSIGCHVGGTLALSGEDVTLVGRAGLAEKLAEGFHVTLQGGAQRRVPPERVRVVTDLAETPEAETVLVCVKSGDTEEVAATIARVASKDALVISLQNGVTNPATLSAHLGPTRVVPGMVGFNVVELAPGAYAQTTEGEVITGPGGAALVEALTRAGMRAQVHQNMEGVQWSKLLMNLNNSINTVSGIGLKAQLEHPGWRRVLAHCVAEGLAVARAEGIGLERLGKVHPRVIPHLLRLPNFLFTRIAGSMLAIDPTARSSMAEDYEIGRKSEVDYLNGHIVARAAHHGLPAPVNARITTVVKAAFENPDRPKLSMTPADILD